MGQCGGWIYGQVGEDIESHARDEFGFDYGYNVRRMAAGMNCGWIRKDGKRLWPLPRTTSARRT